MGWLKTIGQLFKAINFFLSLWREQNEAKAEAKEKIATKVINAFKQTDRKQRASLLNMATDDINRLR